MQTNDLADLLDRSRISQLLGNWGLWRDTCDWTRLAQCYTPGATMLTTWFDGSAADFVDASQRMAAKGANVQHYIGTSKIDIRADRALAVTRVELLVRAELGGVLVDATCYGRFYDRLLKQHGKWLIERRVPVYEKDFIRAVQPGQDLSMDIARLESFPAHYRFLAYLQASGGATISTELPAPNSPAETHLREEEHAWLTSDSFATLETTP